MSDDYWRRVRSRAFQETRHATRIETNERLAVGMIGAVFLGAVVWFVDPQSKTVPWQTRLAPLLVFILVFMGVFLYKLITVPATIDREEREKMIALQEKLDGRKKAQEAVNKLGDLLLKGMNLKKRKISSEEELNKLITELQGWLAETAYEIENSIYKVASQSFIAVPNVIAASISGVFNEKHNTALLHLNAYLSKLQDLIDRRDPSHIARIPRE